VQKICLYLLVILSILGISACNNIYEDDVAARLLKSGILATFSVDSGVLFHKGDTVALVKYGNEEWKMDAELYYEKDTIFNTDKGVVVIQRAVVTEVDFGAGL